MNADQHPIANLKLITRGLKRFCRYRPSSIIRGPIHPSIRHLFLEKAKFKKSIEEQMLPSLFLPQMAVPELEKGRIECYLPRIVLEQFATAHHSHPLLP